MLRSISFSFVFFDTEKKRIFCKDVTVPEGITFKGENIWCTSLGDQYYRQEIFFIKKSDEFNYNSEIKLKNYGKCCFQININQHKTFWPTIDFHINKLIGEIDKQMVDSK